ncbi:MAG: hypothetical protein Q8L26_00130 [Candidatus Omnitrophota bacterium]|nr:hypothetical protein [Candidatus Omnitrophota bacterium]
MKKIAFLLFLFGFSFVIIPCGYTEVPADVSFIVSPAAFVPTISGDKEKFEEDHWLSRNPTAGIKEFSYSKHINKTDTLEMDGRALIGNNDYSFNAEYIRDGLGSLLFEFKEFRKYYDGSGGIASVLPSALSSSYPRVAELDTDLHLDIGEFKLEGVLETEDYPLISLAYIREFKDGVKSLTSWSSVESGVTDPKAYPTFLELDEIVDILKLGVSGEIKDVKASLDQTVEHAEIEMQKINNLTVNTNGSFSDIRKKYENIDFDQYNTIIRLSKQLNDKVFSSFGLMFNHYIGGSIEAITDTSTSSYNENHPWNPASIEYNVVTLLKNFSFTPTKDVSWAAALKAEFSDKNGAARYDRDKNPINGVIDAFRYIKTERDNKKFGESLKFKCSKIKDAVFYAEADFEQEKIGLYESQVDLGTSPDTDVYTRDTDTHQYNNDYKLGFKWYPAAKLNLTAQYNYKQRLRDYDHKERTGDAVSGYSAYMNSLDINSHIPSLRLNYKPANWLAYNLFYSFNTDIYEVRTDASMSTEQAQYKSHVYSIDMTLTPSDYLYLTLLYQKTKAVTFTNARRSTGETVLPAYNADNDVLSLVCNYASSANTTLEGSYSMARADNFDANSTFLPLGLDNLLQDISLSFKRKLTDDKTLDLKYTFSQYDEDSNGGVDDYEAHIIYAGLNVAF